MEGIILGLSCMGLTVVADTATLLSPLLLPVEGQLIEVGLICIQERGSGDKKEMDCHINSQSSFDSHASRYSSPSPTASSHRQMPKSISFLSPDPVSMTPFPLQSTAPLKYNGSNFSGWLNVK